jgi:uncharacterized protein YhjY with autotransporter beta-barrel domain
VPATVNLNDVPAPMTLLEVTPGDPADPGIPPGGPDGFTSATNSTAANSSDSKDMKDTKDMKDMKSSVTYHTSPNDYFQVFLSGKGTHGDIGRENDIGHYYFDRAQGNLGLAYYFADNWTVGTILTYAHMDAGFGNLNSSTTGDSYLGNIFVGYHNGGFFTYLSTTDGYDTFTEDRNTGLGQAHGAGDGLQYGGKLVSGYLFQSGAWSYGPVVDVHGYELGLSGFNEAGAGFNDLRFNRSTSYTLQSQIGGQLRYDTEVCGVHLQPYFWALWQREYGDANQEISGNTSLGSAFATRSVYLDRDAALFDLGVRAVLTSNVDLYLGWEGMASCNSVTNTAQGGVSVSF